MNQKKLGKMGECRFAAWCAEVGLTANPSQEDDKAWDYFVEFPFNSDSNISADMHPSPIKCQIQVKSTDVIDRKKASVRSITLSNLRYLATVPMPTFILFIEYKGQSEPTQAFLVHIDENIIAKILKRVREADIKGKVNELNQKTLTINYDESHELPSLNGKGLKQAIEKYVGNMDSYVGKKLVFIKTVGFENHPVQGSFNLNPKELPNFIEASLGFDKTIELNNFQSSHVRFGIKQPLSKKGDGRAFLSIEPRIYSGVVRFKKDKFSAGVCFNAEIYIAPHHFMPKNSIAFRIKGNFFNIKYINYSDKNFGKSEAIINWFFDIKMNIEKLRKSVSLLNAIKKNNFIIIELENFGNFSSSPPPLECLTQMSDIGSFLDDAKEAVEDAYYLAQYFELDNELSFSLIELNDNKEKINTLKKIIATDLEQKEAFINSKDFFETPKKTAFIQFISILFGNYLVGIILGLSGKLESIKEQEYKLILDKSNIKKIVIPNEKINAFKQDFQVEVENFISNNYPNEDIQVIHNFDFL